MRSSFAKHFYESIAPVALWTSWIVLAMTAVAPLVIVFVVYRLLGLPASVTERPEAILAFAAAGYSVAVGVISLSLRAFHSPPYLWREWLGLCGGLRRKYVPDIFSAYLGYFIISLLLVSLLQLVPGVDISQPQDIGFSQPSSIIGYVIAFLALVVLAPLAEEVLFRGILYGRLRRYAGMWWSVIVTSVAFGVVHQQLNVGVDVAALSIFLCLLRERTGNIWAGVVLHAVKNLIAFAIIFSPLRQMLGA
jgi:membrane protease YdiL (CAAX protease family)